jgi:hypothetical protein
MLSALKQAAIGGFGSGEGSSQAGFGDDLVCAAIERVEPKQA